MRMVVGVIVARFYRRLAIDSNFAWSLRRGEAGRHPEGHSTPPIRCGSRDTVPLSPTGEVNMPVSKNRRRSGAIVKKRRSGATPVKPALPPLPDFHGTMERLLGALGRPEREDPVVAAQEIMYDAWDATSKAKRVALAKKALQISPLCADAYVVLAQEIARDLDEEIGWYRKGVEAGAQAIGPAAFEEDVGHFWGVLETRPYMRARCGLAVALWKKGLRDDAIDHVCDMLRLNPNDNQGMRYGLLAWLAELRRYDEVDTLLREYEGDIAPHWRYTEALLEFIRAGDTARSRKLLADAVAGNPHAPGYLLGLKKLPRTTPDYLTVGGEDEAQEFARNFLTIWQQTPGALEWLAHQVAVG
jgi:tetratricopeptide (TPR) repeat protein